MPNFIYKNEIIEYTLTRNSKKNINFSVKPNGEIYISAPKRVSKSELNSLILERAEWLVTTQEKMLNKKSNNLEINIKNGSATLIGGKKYLIKIISGQTNKVYLHEDFISIQIKEKYIDNQEYINSYFENWQKDIIYNLSKNYIDKYLKLLNLNSKKPALYVRKMTSRWGSCIPSRCKITINKNLIYSPFECLEYVVLHEVAHLIEANHSKNFYAIIEKVMPDWKNRKKLLNNF